LRHQPAFKTAVALAQIGQVADQGLLVLIDRTAQFPCHRGKVGVLAHPIVKCDFTQRLEVLHVFGHAKSLMETGAQWSMRIVKVP